MLLFVVNANVTVPLLCLTQCVFMSFCQMSSCCFSHIEDEPSYDNQFYKDFPYLRAGHGKLWAANFKVFATLATCLSAFRKID